MTPRSVSIAILVAALIGPGFAAIGGVRIAAADDQALRSAKQHFERAQKLYAATRFREALDEYQRAFDADPLPDFLFDIGQCYRNLGDYSAAVFSYRQYLQLAPAAANRGQVEQLISDLEARQSQADSERLGLGHATPATPAAHPATPASQPGSTSEPPPAEVSARPLYKRWWLWTAVAVVGAAGGISIYEATRSHSAPATDLGNIVFGK